MRLVRSRGRVRSVSIHCGAPKTGTKLLQKALSQSVGRIEKTGGVVLLRHDLERLDDRALFRWRRGEIDNSQLGGFWDGLSGLVRESGAQRVFISHEDLLGSIYSMRCGEFYPDAIAALEGLLDCLNARNARVVYRVRRQDNYLEATYLQRIRGGGSESFEEYLAPFVTLEISWADLLERIGSVGGVDRVIARYFEDIGHEPGQYVRTFFRDIAAHVPPRLDFDLESRNRSFSAVALEIARVANPYLKHVPRRRLRHYLDEHLSNRTHSRPILLTEERRAEILAALADDNRRLHTLVESDRPTSPYLPASLERRK